MPNDAITAIGRELKKIYLEIITTGAFGSVKRLTLSAIRLIEALPKDKQTAKLRSEVTQRLYQFLGTCEDQKPLLSAFTQIILRALERASEASVDKRDLADYQYIAKNIMDRAVRGAA